MTGRYHQRGGQLTPDYVCQKASVEDAKPVCQQISGASNNQAIRQLLVIALVLRFRKSP
jgi:hypothetical protein